MKLGSPIFHIVSRLKININHNNYIFLKVINSLFNVIFQFSYLEAIVPGILMQPLPLPARPVIRPLIMGPVRPPPHQPPAALPIHPLLPVQPGHIRGRGRMLNDEINQPYPIYL